MNENDYFILELIYELSRVYVQPIHEDFIVRRADMPRSYVETILDRIVAMGLIVVTDRGVGDYAYSLVEPRDIIAKRLTD
jgi:RIO-like serine/threonine protein kinase